MPDWFQGEVKTTRQAMVPVEVRWTCPEPGCGGEMVFNGTVYPTMEPSYGHTCNKCRKILDLMGARYPRISYEPKGKK